MIRSRLHRGGYRAKPVRRVYIQKPDGGERPLGIASLEDKIVQRAVVRVLNAIYEADFLGFSYGFRPRRRILKRRHQPVPVQGAWLRSVIRGYFGYYAVPTSFERLAEFRKEVIRAWYRALRRRSQRTRLTWERMKILVERWIPPARILHPWPDERFDARTRGRSPVR